MRKAAWRFPLALTLPSYGVSLKFPNNYEIMYWRHEDLRDSIVLPCFQTEPSSRHYNYLSKKADGKPLDLYKSLFKKIMFI